MVRLYKCLPDDTNFTLIWEGGFLIVSRYIPQEAIRIYYNKNTGTQIRVDSLGNIYKITKD